jgi:hypothetical protein
MKVGIFIAALAWSTSASAFDPNGSFIGIYNQNCAQGVTGTMQHFVADKNGNMRPLHDRQASDSMPETAAGCGHGAA